MIMKDKNIPNDFKTPIIGEMDHLYEELINFVDSSIKIPKDVILSLKIKETLNPDIWPNGKLNPEVHKQLIKIADDFIRELAINKDLIDDIIFTGSLANYNWSKFSDIDIHIHLDLERFKDPIMVREYLNAKRNIWNTKHDIKILGYPVEMYAQDINEKHNSSGIYSLLKNKWLQKPKRDDFKIPKEQLIDTLTKYYKALKSAKESYDNDLFEETINKTERLRDKIQSLRKAGLEERGEFSIENISFKILRRTNFIEFLLDLKNKAYDKMMSLSENNLTLMEKSHIKAHLQLLAEAPSKRAYTSDYLRTTYKVSILTNQFKHDDYFMQEDAGEFIAAAIVDIRGNIRISQVAKVPASDLKNNRLGIVRDTKDYMQFYVMAGRGIQHPDTQELPRQTAMTRSGIDSPDQLPTYTKTVHLDNPIQADGKLIKTIDVEVPKPGSPASDAQIKTYLLYGPMIIDFVEKNLATPVGYNDGKATIIRNAMPINKKIQIIRKDAEDQINQKKLPRINFIQAFEKFKENVIDIMTPEQQEQMDTTKMTRDFINSYASQINTNKSITSLPNDQADQIMQRQADLQRKIQQMKDRRNKSTL